MDEFMLWGAELAPDRPAVLELAENGGQTVVSYRQLRCLVDEFAAELDGLGLDVADRVILESDTSAAAIAMFLACSAAGLTFIPVSPETPAARLQAIVEATEPALHLQALAGTRVDLPESVGTGRFGADGLKIERAPALRTRRRRQAAATDPAYIIFTSGTTGRPKGVVMSHRAVLAFYRAMVDQGFVTADDRVASTSPLQFDFSLLDIGLALGSGATVVPVPRTAVRWPRRFVRYLADAGVTHVNGVPSLWRPALRREAGALAGLDRIRGILFCGEPFPMPELRRLQQLLPAARIINCFGHTESMACSFEDVPNPIPEDLERLSVGFAHRGAELAVFDEEGRPITEPGVVGEIYLRSPALFHGYWGDPAATARALVPDPLNPRSGQTVFRSGDLGYLGQRGELYSCGRADSQVKVRGNRVELGEVERRIQEFPGVQTAAVLLLPGPGGEDELTAFVVPESSGPGVDEAEVRAFCLSALPDYMAPREIRLVDGLPVTANGKLDRAELAVRRRS